MSSDNSGGFAGFVSQLGARFARVFRAITPDPFVLAIALTALTMLLAMALRSVSFGEAVAAWHGGIWSLLGFSMQMCLILVTGHAIASAPQVRKLIDRIVDIPKSAGAAGALVAAVAIFTSLLNWGLGLIVGALMAREMGKRCEAKGLRVHYPLLAAAGYTGLMTWHGGFSGSAPLKVARAKDLSEMLGADLASKVATVSTYDTILSPMNIFVSAGLLVLIPLLIFLLMPRDESQMETVSSFDVKSDEDEDVALASSIAERLETSRWTTLLLIVPMAGAAFFYYRANGVGKLDPNAVNLTLLLLGLVLHGSPRAYVAAVNRAVSGCAGIILQFPLYAGIMGLMKTTGLAKLFASWAAGLGSAKAYAVATFFIAGLINFFVPSGGGQWAVQGPIAVQAASELNVSLAHAVMAVAYGDQWTNMLQPFWALPLLGITGVKAKDLVGYTGTVMLFGGAWVILGLLLFVG